jgi:hypothetical protein
MFSEGKQLGFFLLALKLPLARDRRRSIRPRTRVGH